MEYDHTTKKTHQNLVKRKVCIHMRPYSTHSEQKKLNYVDADDYDFRGMKLNKSTPL